MTRLWLCISACVALLAACAGDPDKDRLASPRERVVTVYTFPSSLRQPKGKPWTKMRPEGFTGSYRDACNLMRLNAAECRAYERMHSSGQCLTMEVPNGTVLDWLTYTRRGKHVAQQDVLVSLLDPPSRTAAVCDLGNGVYAIRFHGCNNHAVVRNRLARVVTYDRQLCSANWYVKTKSWTPSALGVDGVRTTIAATKRGYEKKDRLSRQWGDAIEKCAKLGDCSMSTHPYRITASYIKDEDGNIRASKPIGSFTLTNGEAKIPASELAGSSWNAVRVVYHDDEFRLQSPLVGRTGEKEIRVYNWEFKEAPCEPGRLIHSIEKENIASQ